MWIAGLDHGVALWAGAMARACWQGGIALALAWALCRAWSGLPPPARCWLWRLAYFKLLVALFWATPVDLPLLPASAAPAVLSAAPRSSLCRQSAETAAAETPTPPSRTEEGSVAEGRLRALVAVVSTARHRTDAWHPSAAGSLMFLWLLGLGACGVQFAREWRETQLLITGCQWVSDQWLNSTSSVVCRQLGIRRIPPLAMTEDVDSPLLAGVARPVIVLPVALLTECTPAELALMLAHELAHMKRRDLQWAWLPMLVRALFWFHPLVRLADREWRLAQEMACDEMAVLTTNVPVSNYGDMLLRVAAQGRARSADRLVAVGILESYHTLQRRLKAMKTIGPISSRRMVFIGGMIATLAVGALVPWRVTAQTSGTANDKASIDSANRDSDTRLKQLGRALLMYGQDWDGVLPPMKTPAEAKKALDPYVRRNDAVFLQPGTTEAYRPNPSVSGKQVGRYVQFRSRQHGTLRLTRSGKAVFVSQVLPRRGEVPVTTYVILPDGSQDRNPTLTVAGLRKQINRGQSRPGTVVLLAPSRTVAFYEPTAALDGSRGAVFLDGHVARVSEAEWQRLRRFSGIP